MRLLPSPTGSGATLGQTGYYQENGRSSRSIYVLTGATGMSALLAQKVECHCVFWLSML